MIMVYFYLNLEMHSTLFAKVLQLSTAKQYCIKSKKKLRISPLAPTHTTETVTSLDFQSIFFITELDSMKWDGMQPHFWRGEHFYKKVQRPLLGRELDGLLLRLIILVFIRPC